MKQLLYYLKSNKGSGVVVVMLALLFLTAFGTLALYLSYTNVSLSVAERTGMETSVNAYTCMDEVKAGVQQIVSDAIAETYTAVMPFYSKENQNISNSFKEKFNEVVVTCTYNDGTNENALFTDNATKYQIKTLEKMIREKRGYSVDVYSGNLGKGFGTEAKGNIVKLDANGNEINDAMTAVASYVLKDITLEFTGKNNYKSSVTTDIVIACPDVGYLLTQYSIKGIPNFAMVANGTISQTIDNDSAIKTNVVVNGDVYAGNVKLNGDSTFKVGYYSTFICKDTISIAGGGNKHVSVQKGSGDDKYYVHSFDGSPRLEMDSTSTVWAQNIKIDSKSCAAFYGTTYVKNDLIFSGHDSFIKLGSYIKNTRRRTGSFYGFGTSESVDTESSAIIANGEKNKLDLTELGSLTVAGYSFISNYVSQSDTTRLPAEGGSSQIRMGESTSAKQNQLLYYTKGSKVTYYEYVTVIRDNKTLKVNYTGSIIEGDYPNCKYYEEVIDDNTLEVKKVYHEETYAPQTVEYVITDQDYFAIFTAAERAKIVRFGLVGESYVWKDGQFVLDTEAEGTVNGYSTEYIDDSLFADSERDTNSDPDDDTLYHKTFADYHARLCPVYEIINKQYVVHFYLTFATTEDSNKYFIASFFTNPRTIRNELTGYLSMFGLDSGMASTASGSIYTDDSYTDISYALSQSVEAIKKNAEFISEIFTNYCTTLSNEKLDSSEVNIGTYPATNPFDTYIYREKIDALSTEKTNVERQFSNSAGQVVAIIAKGDYTFDSSKDDTICLIIATGDVYVSDDFNGLILTYGDIIIQSSANFTQNYEAVLSAFQATYVSGSGDKVATQSVKDYFKRNITKNYTIDNGKTVESVDAYDINKMVYYNNWSE